MESGNYRGRTDAVGACIAVTIFLTSLITGNEFHKMTTGPNQAVVPENLHKPETSQPLPNVNTPENELSPIPPKNIKPEITKPEEQQKNRPYLKGIIIPLEDKTRETNKSLSNPL